MKTSILKNRRKSIISKILIIIIWILLSYFIDNEIIFPRIGSTLNSLIDIVKSPPKFLNIVWYSLLRSIVGFAISLFLAIIMGGLISSISKTVYYLMLPIINFFNFSTNYGNYYIGSYMVKQ